MKLKIGNLYKVLSDDNGFILPYNKFNDQHTRTFNLNGSIVLYIGEKPMSNIVNAMILSAFLYKDKIYFYDLWEYEDKFEEIFIIK